MYHYEKMYFLFFCDVFIVKCNDLPVVALCSLFFFAHFIISNLHPTPIIINMSRMMIANIREITMTVVICKFLQKIKELLS